MIAKLQKLQAGRGQYPNMRVLAEALKKDKALRSDVMTLSRAFLHREVSGCSSCFTDAYLELLHLKIQNVMEKLKCKFELRAGAMAWVGNNYYTNANLSDAVALEWINKDPSRVEMFRVLPEDLDTMLVGFVREQSGVKPVEVKTTKVKQAPKIEQAPEVESTPEAAPEPIRAPKTRQKRKRR